MKHCVSDIRAKGAKLPSIEGEARDHVFMRSTRVSWAKLSKADVTQPPSFKGIARDNFR